MKGIVAWEVVTAGEVGGDEHCICSVLNTFCPTCHEEGDQVVFLSLTVKSQSGKGIISDDTDHIVFLPQ